MKEKLYAENNSPSQCQTRGKSLLRKYDIPVEHLDFRYLEKCNDVREIERILKVLRSGEEGHFPELEAFATRKLEELNPKSRLLRVEVPVLRSQALSNEEVKKLEQDFLGWTAAGACNTVGNDAEGTDEHLSKAIFTVRDSYDESKSESIVDAYGLEEIPIRSQRPSNASNEKSEIATTKQGKSTADRIKSWEYDKWDKFDVEAELTKLDVGDMKRDEWELSSHKKKQLKDQQKIIERLMRNENTDDLDLLLPPSEQKFRRHDGESSQKESKGRENNPVGGSTSIGAESHPNNVTGAGDCPIPSLEDVEPRASCPKLSSSAQRHPRLDPQPCSSKNAIESLLKISKQSRGSLSPSSYSGCQQLFDTSGACQNHQRSSISVKTPSFIEEIPEDEPRPASKNPKSNNVQLNKRRFKIHIEDLNVG